jgi:7-cyano-7-deazaguanine reductase
MPSQPSRTLETFPNPHPDRLYEIDIDCPEFTSVCPLTGQPDFGTIHIHYIPGPRCVELKSLKLYLWSYRQEGAFYEDLTNRICNDLVAALDPIRLTVTGSFRPRGGITTVVKATYEASRPESGGIR